MKSPHRLLRPAIVTAALAILALPSGGCSSANSTRAVAAARAVYLDATSPAGQRLLADVTSTALHVGLDLAAGNDAAAAIAGVQGAASAVRDYEGLPVAPSSATVAHAAAAGSGVAQVAAALLPQVQTLLTNAQSSAAQQNVHVTTDDLIEAFARGFDAVADAKYVPSAQ